MTSQGYAYEGCTAPFRRKRNASRQSQVAALPGRVAPLFALRGTCRDSIGEASPGAVRLRMMDHCNPHAKLQKGKGAP